MDLGKMAVEQEEHPQQPSLHVQAPHDTSRTRSSRVAAIDDAIQALVKELHAGWDDEDDDDDLWAPIRRHPTRSDDDSTPEDAADDGFDPADVYRPPAGYRRDRVGRWRYEWSGRYVPGAADVTLGQLHQFEPYRGEVFIPRRLAVADDTLEWATRYPIAVRGATVCHIVPAGVWETARRSVVTLHAGELSCQRLYDPNRLAQLLGVKRNTVHAYQARNMLPEPVAKIGATPVWSLPALLDWFEHRRSRRRAS